MDPPPGDAQPCSVEGQECASFSICSSLQCTCQTPNSTQECNEYEYAEPGR